jgi:hypothetical protein
MEAAFGRDCHVWSFNIVLRAMGAWMLKHVLDFFLENVKGLCLVSLNGRGSIYKPK